MSSSSPHQLNGHASSSRSPLSSSASPREDDDEGAELANGLLEEEDPLHGDGSNFDERYGNHRMGISIDHS